MKNVEIGKVYRHFKGNYYFVENIGKHSETGENVVIYKHLYSSDDPDGSYIWVRPENMFIEKIDPNKKGNITGQSYRFELVENLSKDYTN